MSAFADLCEIAERCGLAVEISTNAKGTAVFVVDDRLEADFQVAGVQATMRRAVVATPFWDVPFDAGAPQLIDMLERKGYS